MRPGPDSPAGPGGWGWGWDDPLAVDEHLDRLARSHPVGTVEHHPRPLLRALLERLREQSFEPPAGGGHAGLDRQRAARPELAAERPAGVQHQFLLSEHQGHRLRGDVASLRASIAAAPRATVDQYATTASELLADCGRELADVAAKADGHAADVRLMLAAWPK